LKSRGVPVPWIPPTSFSERLVSSPEQGREAVAEYFRSTGNGHEDRNSIDWRLVQDMYAAYVLLLDRWLGILAEAIERCSGGDDVLFIVTSAAGMALGERFRRCDVPRRMREEIVHTPLLVRMTGNATNGSRRQELVQSVDLAPTLLEWFCVEPGGLQLDGRSLIPGLRGADRTGRTAAFLGDGAGVCAIRTETFYCVKGTRDTHGPHSESPGKIRLFVKPEDVWDMNDALGLFPDAADSLVSRLDEFVSAKRVTGRSVPNGITE
jgi:hypothetical protein